MWIIAGKFRRVPLHSPKGKQTRPTSSRLRESLFNICQNKILGAHFLDLFAGSGAMGFEALSRGASSATFIDSHYNSIQCIKQNASKLGVESLCHILHGDVFTMLTHLEKQMRFFDIIYADPPYRTGGNREKPEDFYSKQIIYWIDQHAILKPEGVLFVEEEFNVLQDPIGLENITLKDSRRMGPADLYHFQKISFDKI